jgi:hypothetical protein
VYRVRLLCGTNNARRYRRRPSARARGKGGDVSQDTYRLLFDAMPIARREHRCIWCGQTIPIGSKYRHEKSVYDCRIQDHHWHLECDESAAEYFTSGEDEFDPYDNLRPIHENKRTQP